VYWIHISTLHFWIHNSILLESRLICCCNLPNVFFAYGDACCIEKRQICHFVVKYEIGVNVSRHVYGSIEMF
jgi:hypothetical protein